MAKEALKEEEIEVEIEEAPEPEEVDTSEELEVPEGGIGDFVMDDDELDEVYAEKAEDYGNEGIAQFPALAERMAKYGRNEDNMLAHVAEGELIIPRQFIEDEVMKQRIYEVLEEAGVEDPEAYVVGAEANDINPTTGLPEFFLKKLFKKIGRGLKKIVKKVVKVVKKIAPIVLPIALAFTPLGAVYGAALGSGIGTLINGGTLKDALKSALISGAIGGVTSGFTGPHASFGENVAASFADPAARFSQAASGLTGPDKFFTKYTPTGTSGPSVDAATPDAVTPDAVTPDAVTDPTRSGSISFERTAAPQVKGDPYADLFTSPNNFEPLTKPAVDVGAGTTALEGQPFAADRALAREAARETARGAGTTVTETVASGKPPGVFESAKNIVMPGDEVGPVEGLKDLFFPGDAAVDVNAVGGDAFAKAYENAMTLPGMDEATARKIAVSSMDKAITAAEAAASPGFVRTYGPAAAVGTGYLVGSGAFEEAEIKQPDFIEYERDTGRPTTGSDLIDRNPENYLISDIGHSVLDPETGEYVRKPSSARLELDQAVSSAMLPPLEPLMQAAQGGPIFPRRTGGIEPTEGVSGEDSVPAMLMPGEFVMTTEAVRGAGRGNLDNGIQNMYSIMRNLESRGRANA
jgi:hypothetical protein